MSHRRSFPLLSLVLVAVTCLTMLSPLASLAEDRTEAPDSTVSNPPAESESPPEQNTQPGDSNPQPTMPDAIDPLPTEPQDQPEQSQPQIQLQAPWLSVNGVQSALEVTDATPLVAVAGSLNDGAAYSLTIAGGHGCGGGQQFELGTGERSGQLTTELGSYAAGTYSFQAVDATNGGLSNCVNVTVFPAFVEEPTDEPAATDISTEEPSPTDELIGTEISATEVPTEIHATENPTDQPPPGTPTSEPTVEASPGAPQTETTLSPIAEIVASPSAEPANIPFTAAESGGLTINGSSGPLELSTSIYPVVYIPDMIEADVMSDAELYAGLPSDAEDKSWNIRGTLTGHDGPNCATPVSQWSYQQRFAPDYSANFSLGPQAAGTRSYRAVSELEITYYDGFIHSDIRMVGTSNCVNVTFSAAQLSINGETELLTATEMDSLFFSATGLPASATHQLVWWSFGCGGGTSTLIQNYPASRSISEFVPALPQRTYWFQVNSHAGGVGVGKTNCVVVTVAGVQATLRVNSSTGPVSVSWNQNLALFAEGFAPSTVVELLVYESSTTCGGHASRYNLGPADPFGVIESFTENARLSNHSFAMRAGGEHTNCVVILPNQDEASLTVNGNRGPIPIRVGDELTVVGSNLPLSRPGFLSSFATAECGGTPSLSAIGSTSEGTVEFAEAPAGSDVFSYRVEIDGVLTNCLTVRIYEDLADPPLLTVNGLMGPVTVTTNEVFTLTASRFQPDAAVQLHVFPGTDVCAPQAAVVTSGISNTQGQVAFDKMISDPGITSFFAVFLNGLSNCVVVSAAAPVDPGQPTPTPLILEPNPYTPTPGSSVNPGPETPRATVAPGGEPTGPSTTPDSGEPGPTLTPPASTSPGESVRGLPSTGSGARNGGLPLAVLVALVLTLTALAAGIARRSRLT